MFEINFSNGQFYYDLFYFLAIVFAGIAFILHGKRKNYPLTEWSLIYASAVIFLIIGTKLFTYSTSDWSQVITTGIFPYTSSKTILGGIVGGVIGVWIVTKLLRFKYPVLDAFAVSFPLAMGIQRIGCFLAGCCWGSPTELPWAVSYSDRYLPYHFHLEQGFIEPFSNFSMSIHPNQLYQVILCFGIALLIWKIRNRFRRPGNLFFTSIAFYLVVRIIIEFTRDDTTQGLAENLWMGMNRVQWILSGILPLLVAFIFYRERKFKPSLSIRYEDRLSTWYFIFLCLFMLIAGTWFTRVEGFYIAFVLIPTTMFCINEVADVSSRNYRLRLFSIYTLLFGFIGIGILTAQRTYNELTSSDVSENSFNEWTIGYGNLGYNHYHAKPNVFYTTGCDGERIKNVEPVGDLFKHRSISFGLGYSNLKTFGKYEKLSLSGTFAATIHEKEYNDSSPERFSYDISPSVFWTHRWVGFGAGLRVGSEFAERSEEDSFDRVYYSESHKPETYINPYGKFVLGPYDLIYSGVSFNENFPYQLGFRANASFRGFIGTGLGQKNGTFLEYSFYGDKNRSIGLGVYINNRFGIKTMYMGSTNYIDRFWSVSLSHRIIKK